MFYDAEHSDEACHGFYWRVKPLLAKRCILAFDDADWPEMSELGRLAVEDGGFEDVTRRDLYRSNEDKANRATYTLRVMAR